MRDLAKVEPEIAARLEQRWKDWATPLKFRLHSMGSEPVYRHLHDAKEQFLGGKGDDSQDEDVPKPETKNKKSKSRE